MRSSVPEQARPDASAKARAPLPKVIIALGVTSLLTDVGTEMIFPLLPLFLVQTLGATGTFVGLVEGAADATASLLKLASGTYSDRLTRRKPLVVFGYALASAARPLVALATLPWHVLAVRVTDRVGKGVRSSPRDALLADAAPPGQAGRAFGFHQAMDHAGAVFGPLAAAGLLALGLGLRSIFWWTLIPGALATLVVASARETPRLARRAASPSATASTMGSSRAEGRARSPEAQHLAADHEPPLPRRLVTLLAVLALFSLGNSSDAFLLLRARDLGVATAAIPVLWATLSVSKLVSAYWAGAASDRRPRVSFTFAGWAVYALAYLGLSLAREAWQGWALFIVYGWYYGLTEPTQKALVRDITDERIRGRAFGWYNFVIGASALPAGLLTGFLWQTFGPAAALLTGAGLAAAAAVLLGLWSVTHAPRRERDTVPGL